jgi:hypothetical protein
MTDSVELERQLGRAMFNRVLRHLETDEVEFIRDEFVLAGERHPNYPDEAYEEEFDFADLAHDEWEIRRYGRIISFDSVRDD